MSTNDDAPAALAGFPERLLPMAVPLDTLRDDPRNARTHSTRNLDAVRFSLATFGWRGLVIVREDDRTIVAGHARVAAARELGWTHAPVLFVDEARARSIAFAIADNRTAELAEWDDAALAATLRELRDDDAAWLDGLEFNAEELHEIAPDVFEAPRTEEADDVPEAPAPRDVVTRRGDLWLLGDHRLLCGDSTKAEDVARLMDGEKPALVASDPPYGINHPTDYKARGRDNLAACRDYPAVVGDDSPYDPTSLLALAVPTILWGGNWFASRLPDSGGWLVWDKDRPDDLDQATCELAWTNCVKGVRRIRYLWHGMRREGNESLVHPTQKPVAVVAWSLRLKWVPDGLVYDPFLGSGTTLIAAEQLGRRCFGMEISPAYCDVVVRRWENLTGKRARRVTADDAEVF